MQGINISNLYQVYAKSPFVYFLSILTKALPLRIPAAIILTGMVLCHSVLAVDSRLYFHWQGPSGNTEILQAAGFHLPESERTAHLLPEQSPSLHFNEAVFTLIRGWYSKSRSDLAGPGFYMSASPFDSSHYGTNLLIVEVTPPTDVPFAFPKNNHKERADNILNSQNLLDPAFDDLPLAVDYSGSWHCIYRMPKAGDPQVSFRPPRQGDAALLARQIIADAALNTSVHGKMDKLMEAVTQIFRKQNDPRTEPPVKILFTEVLNILLEEIVDFALSFEPDALSFWLLNFSERIVEYDASFSDGHRLFASQKWRDLLARPLDRARTLTVENACQLAALSGRILGPQDVTSIAYRRRALQSIKREDLERGVVKLKWFAALIESETPESLAHVRTWILKSPLLHPQTSFDSRLMLYGNLLHIYGAQETEELRASLIAAISDPDFLVEDVNEELAMHLGPEAAIRIFVREFRNELQRQPGLLKSIMEGQRARDDYSEISDRGRSFFGKIIGLGLLLVQLQKEALPTIAVFSLFQMLLDEWYASDWSKIFFQEGSAISFINPALLRGVVSHVLSKALLFYVENSAAPELKAPLTNLLASALQKGTSFNLRSFAAALGDDHDFIKNTLLSLVKEFPGLQPNLAQACRQMAHVKREGLVQWNVLALELEPSIFVLPLWKSLQQLIHSEVATDHRSAWSISAEERRRRENHFGLMYSESAHERSTERILFHLGRGPYNALHIQYNDLARLFVLMEPLFVSEDLRRFSAREPWRRFNESYERNGITIEQPTWANFLANWNQSGFQTFFLMQRLQELSGTARQREYEPYWWPSEVVAPLFGSLLAAHVDGSSHQAVGRYAASWDRQKFVTQVTGSQWQKLTQENPDLLPEIQKYFDITEDSSGTEVSLRFKTFDSLVRVFPGLWEQHSGMQPESLLHWIFNEVGKTLRLNVKKGTAELLHHFKMHPMENGNGRVSRFLAAQFLTAQGLPLPVGLPNNDFFMTVDDLQWEVRKSLALGRLWQKMLKKAADDQVPINDFFQSRFRGSRLEGLMHIRPLNQNAFHNFVKWLEAQQDLDGLPEWLSDWMGFLEQNLLKRYVSRHQGLAHVSEVQRFFDLDAAWVQFASRHSIPFSECENDLKTGLDGDED